MTLSISDFQNATAYPCGKDKKSCHSLLKGISELEDVKMYSVRDTLEKGSKSTFSGKRKSSSR